MKQEISVAVKFSTPILAALILLALYGAFLFDTDGAAIGLTYLGYEKEAFFAAFWRLIGDLVWIIGLVAAMLATGAIINLVNDEKLTQTAILRYLTTRKDRTPVEKLYPDHAWAKPIFYLNCVMAVVGMASGFWFTGTVWLVSMIATHAQHKQLRKATVQLDGLARRKGLDGVRRLATPESLAVVDKSNQPKED